MVAEGLVMKRYFWIAGVLMLLGIVMLAAEIGPPAVSAMVSTVGVVLVVIAENNGAKSS
jgi:hypothetical protein